jgi:hypothetical protein
VTFATTSSPLLLTVSESQGRATFLLADAEEAADADDDGPNLAVLVDGDAVDFAYGLALRILDIATDELVGIDLGRRGRQGRN